MLTSLKEYFIKSIHKSIYKPGHYYSPIPDAKEIQQHQSEIFKTKEDVPGIDLNFEGQQKYLRGIQGLISECKLTSSKSKPHRYYTRNPFFLEADALYFQAILKDFKPKRIIEVGSGFSSALLLDTVDAASLNINSIELIEPYPERLYSLLEKEDVNRVTILNQRVQDIDTKTFTSLDAGDILFIDSSHVSKIGSDVNFLFFEVLPALKPGVLIHIHDILYPFEYPREWIFKGRFWNEAYLLRAFLMFNPQFKILIFHNYLRHRQIPFLTEIDKRLVSGGGSIWIQKI